MHVPLQGCKDILLTDDTSRELVVEARHGGKANEAVEQAEEKAAGAAAAE